MENIAWQTSVAIVKQEIYNGGMVLDVCENWIVNFEVKLY